MFGLGRFFVYKRYWIPFGLFLGFTLLLWKGLSIESKNLPDMLSERQLPKFTLPLINDPMKMITEEELKGQVGLIHVWATWCSVCLQEHAELLSLTKRYPDYPIYGINFQDEPEAVLSWLSSQGNPFKLSMLDEEGHLGFELGLRGTPETFILDKQGSIRYHHVGMLTLEEFEKNILPKLKSLNNELKI
jgi:cytochrome c biogenesis protein CcmG/thiol:disulfide interchange protein DsbE